ncbi:MAG: beta-lactamase family protein [Opitutaceae bacterium]|nr:beta-lactamase family protein [Opitutaceae bacterium]
MIKIFDRRKFLISASATAASAIAYGPAIARTIESANDPLATIPGLPTATPERVGVAPDLTARINAFMQHQIESGHLTGGVTGIARRGKLIHFSSHGMLDIEAGTPMIDDRLFQMMSSTKPVTAVALLQQMEAGKVALDDKISRYIPELKEMRVRVAATSGAPVETIPANRELTIKDLATHTSGLNGFLLDIPPGTPNTLAARIPYAKNIPLDFQPGTKWAYSAVTGSDILARVIEITSGLSFDRYLKERIFEPIGMRDTAFNLTDEQRTRVVPRYSRQENTWHREVKDMQLAEILLARTYEHNPKTTYFPGSFGLYSTARDYLLFETMLLNKGTIHGNRVIRPDSVSLMQSNLVGNLYDGGSVYPNTKGTGFGVLVRTVLDPATCDCGRKAGGFGWGGAYGTISWTDPLNELIAVYMVQQRVHDAEVEFEKVIAGALRS